ncbi:hypothetical protein BpHYR1_001928 [Brachionus plicatilis]|uniref:Uncharacterized protein n=1 Tax=Brachionus plicatilis TaxID=10195 RepID=A0A3M7RRF0_BRAPC|nr:hypothetical protein BpHYR1_001928 [Brachionus plicatilis]
MVNTKITSVEHLKSVLFDEWLKVPSEIVKNMIESMSLSVLKLRATILDVKNQIISLKSSPSLDFKILSTEEEIYAKIATKF